MTTGYTLTAGDETYTLVESMNAYCAMEALTGKTTGETLIEAARGSLSATRALLWAHLQRSHGAQVQTLDDAGAIVDAAGLATVQAQLEQMAGVTFAPEPEPPRGRKRRR